MSIRQSRENIYHKKQRFLVLGMGKSGVSAAELLCGAGKEVVIIDQNQNEKIEASAQELRQLGVKVYTGIDKPADIFDSKNQLAYKMFDICVVSPGIAVDNLWLQAVENAGVHVISELELGVVWWQHPIIAITGTNGKSTCVKLCGDMLRSSGMNPVLAGNYGKPLSKVASEQENYDIAVVEVSTFQLEHISDFHPNISILLNIQPDHLDRHGNMDVYKKLKTRLFDNMKEDDLALVYASNIDDVQRLTSGTPEYKSFGTDEGTDYCYIDRNIRYKSYTNGENEEINLFGSVFANKITGLTAAAVCGVGDYFGIDTKNIRQAIKQFEPLPHRVQIIGEADGILYIDDSKATNIAALAAALEMMTRPVHLIVGGQLKEENITNVKTLLAEMVKYVYCIGESMEIFYHNWHNIIECKLCGDMKTAMEEIEKNAIAGDIVLLSPGCASFDQFDSYKERGNFFQELVKNKM